METAIESELATRVDEKDAVKAIYVHKRLVTHIKEMYNCMLTLKIYKLLVWRFDSQVIAVPKGRLQLLETRPILQL